MGFKNAALSKHTVTFEHLQLISADGEKSEMDWDAPLNKYSVYDSMLTS